MSETTITTTIFGKNENKKLPVKKKD